MTGKERMATAMALGIPDRVPVMAQMALGHIYLQTGLSPVEVWHDPAVYADALCLMRERYGFDGILVSVPGSDPEWRARVGTMDERGGHYRITWRAPVENYSPYPLGSHTLYRNDDLPEPLDRPVLPTIQDLDPESVGVLDPVPDWMLSNLRAVLERAGTGFSIHGETFSAFDKLVEVLGPVNALMALVDAPDRVHAVLARGVAYAANWGIAQALVGCDAVKVSSPFVGGGFLSREMYREFVVPYERELIGRIRAAAPGVRVYTHTCGAIGDRLELIAESGTDGLECLDPPPLGDVELADAKRRVGASLFIKGNVDSVNTLLMKDLEGCRRDVRETLRAGKPGGGFILSTACSIAPPVRREHVRVLLEVAEAEGVYDQ